MNIDCLPVGPIGTNCFIVSDDAGTTLIIDPGDDGSLILDSLEPDAKVAAVILTHGHTDHISALAEVVRATSAPVAIHPADLAWAFSDANQLPPIYGVPDRPACEIRELTAGSLWTDGNLKYRVIHTPGHTPGGVCLHFEDEHVLFCGDTLFAGSIGRTDLNGGDMNIIMASLKRLSALPPETICYPGHGPATTIERELKINPFLQQLR